MNYFNLIVVMHLAEHIAQTIQLWVFHLPRPECLGLVGYFVPSLMRSEWLHYLYAYFMAVGLIFHAKYFRGLAGKYWRLAMGLSVYHTIEHSLLLSQALLGHNLWGSSVPISIGQLFIPRIELHLLYNLIIVVPMFLAFHIRVKNIKQIYQNNGNIKHK